MRWLVVKTLSLSFVTFFVTSVCFADSVFASEDRVQGIGRSLNTIFQCPERVWPGLKAEGFRIVFSKPSQNQAWFYDAANGNVTAVSQGDISTLNLDSNRYAFSSFRNERAVIVNLEQVSQSPTVPTIAIDSAFNTAFHEGFHFLFQMKAPWVAQHASVPRDPNVDYVEALYLRRMLISTLLNELENGQGFGRSSYWLKRWKATGEAPETKFSDVLEGTAYFAEVVATIVAQEGCHVSEDKIIALVASNLRGLVNKPVDRNVRKQFFQEYQSSGYQIEGYEIGLLSLLAMRKAGRVIGSQEYKMGRDYYSELQLAQSNQDKIQIMNEMQEGIRELRTPIDIFLEGVTPAADKEDLHLLSEIRESAKGT